jgi:SAM-dependent methyltransferase
MKLSELVAYKNQIEAMSVNHAARNIITDINKIVYGVGTDVVPSIHWVQHMQHQVDNIRNSLSEIERTITDAKLYITNQISMLERPEFEKSTLMFNEEYSRDSVQWILDRQFKLPPDTLDQLKHRVKLYSNWQFPGMVIHPGRETFVRDIIGCDPVYLVDTHEMLTIPAVESFNVEHQPKLRCYTISDRKPGPILDKLPQNQFGIVVAYNYLHYRPLEVIHQYLQEVFNLLRPGGHFVFTYNNCDLTDGVRMYENCGSCYTPGHFVRSYAQQVGFEIVYRETLWHSVEWLELKRPGHIKGMRGGQSFARVVAKSK